MNRSVAGLSGSGRHGAGPGHGAKRGQAGWAKRPRPTPPWPRPLLRKGQLEQAVEAADLALAEDPQSAEAHRVRGWLYREATDRAGAVAEFQAAADLQPELWLGTA